MTAQITYPLMHKLFLVVAFLASLSSLARAEVFNVYFGTSNSEGIYHAKFDTDTGTLSEPTLAIAIENPGFIAIHPNQKYLYSTTKGGKDNQHDGVAAMQILPDGTLKLLNKQPSLGKGACFVSVDAAGLCLMLANYGGGNVNSYKIGEDGTLSMPKSNYPHKGRGENEHRQRKPHPHSIIANVGNNYAYAPDLGTDKVMIYKLDIAHGMLSMAGEATIPGGGMGPRHMTWSFGGQYAYVLNELKPSVSMFKFNASDGGLEFLETVSILPEGVRADGFNASEIKLHPRNGLYLYAANRDRTDQMRDSISVFSSMLHKDGFKLLGQVPAEVSVPRNFNLDPSGQWMLVGGKIAGYRDLQGRQSDGYARVFRSESRVSRPADLYRIRAERVGPRNAPI